MARDGKTCFGREGGSRAGAARRRSERTRRRPGRRQSPRLRPRGRSPRPRPLISSRGGGSLGISPSSFAFSSSSSPASSSLSRLGIRVRILEVIRLVRDLTHAALKPAFPVVHLQAHGPGTVLDEPQDQLDDHHLARRVQQRALEPVRGERGKPHDRSERVAKGKHGVELPIAAKREDSLPRLRVRILQSARRTPILKLWIIARGRVPAGHRRRQPPRAPSCGDRDRSAGTRKDFRQNARGRLAVCILEKCRDPGPADSWVHRP